MARLMMWMTVLIPFAIAAPAANRTAAMPELVANANVDRAGALRDGKLVVALEAKRAAWHVNGDGHPAVPIEAFADESNATPPMVPGPLVRVPQGTEIDWAIRNSLEESLIFLVPASVRQATGWDTVRVGPGAVAHLVTRAAASGNFGYRAMSA